MRSKFPHSPKHSLCLVRVTMCRDGEILVVDEDVEEGARDLLELNDEGGSFSVPRKRGRCMLTIIIRIQNKG